MNVRRIFFALSLAAASAMVAAPAFAAGPFGNGGHGTSSGPFTPGSNGAPSGPYTPGSGSQPSRPGSGPFTPGTNGAPSGPFTPGERPDGGRTEGPFSNDKGSSGGFWGGVKRFVSGVGHVFSKVFDFIAMWDLMGRWFGALIPHGATGTMPANGAGSNVGRNTNTNPPTMNNQPPASSTSTAPVVGHTGATQPGRTGNGVNREPTRVNRPIPEPRRPGSRFISP